MINFILLNFFLQFLEVFKLFHHLFQIIFFLYLSEFNIHHLAPNNKNTLMNLKIVIIIELKSLQLISSIKTIVSSNSWSLRIYIHEKLTLIMRSFRLNRFWRKRVSSHAKLWFFLLLSWFWIIFHRYISYMLWIKAFITWTFSDFT